MKEENIYNYCHIAGRTDIGCKRQDRKSVV